MTSRLPLPAAPGSDLLVALIGYIMLFRAEYLDFSALKDMPRPNNASSTPPFEVESALKQLGANLRTARLARNLSIEAAAAKIGVGYRAVATAETGKPGTAIGVYVGLMWAYGLLPQFTELADPARDEVVQRAARARERAYPTGKGALDNDF